MKNLTDLGRQAPTPLDVLAACHDRMQGQCATLRDLADQVVRHGVDGPTQAAIAAALHDIDTLARRHHADEEIDLFPALIESMAGSDPVCLRALTDALTADHRRLERDWNHLRHALDRVAAGDPTALTADGLRDFVDRYERHIGREDAELLPMAQRLIDDAELARIGLAMRTRRAAADAAAAPRPASA